MYENRMLNKQKKTTKISRLHVHNIVSFPEIFSKKGKLLNIFKFDSTIFTIQLHIFLALSINKQTPIIKLDYYYW